MKKKTNSYIIILLVFYLESTNFAFSALANENFKNDLGLWTAINVNAPIKGKLESRFQISPRWLDNTTDFNQFILHALLGYKFNNHLSIFQGYAWNTLHIPNFKREQRPYQELTISHDANQISFEHRFRLDERFLQDIEGISLRARYRLKGSYPIDKAKKWFFVLFDEIFVNLNSHFDGPQAGLDQNRIYAGINHKFNENISADLGYQLQHFYKRSGTDNLNHFIFFYLNFYLPPFVN
ncbi:MAG: DUF2490 domain-containing protein [Candidatus Melainabacteria bacterium]|nr:DUF2490 domain-containing protein [Candidatus Melainabacteria bacterium]